MSTIGSSRWTYEQMLAGRKVMSPSLGETNIRLFGKTRWWNTVATTPAAYFHMDKEIGGVDVFDEDWDMVHIYTGQFVKTFITVTDWVIVEGVCREILER